MAREAAEEAIKMAMNRDLEESYDHQFKESLMILQYAAGREWDGRFAWFQAKCRDCASFKHAFAFKTVLGMQPFRITKIMPPAPPGCGRENCLGYINTEGGWEEDCECPQEISLLPTMTGMPTLPMKNRHRRRSM